MTREDIIRMAALAGFEIDCCSLEWHDRIERFAALVAEHERDRYAEKFAELIAPKICELLTEHRQFKAAVIVGQYFRGESND